MSRPKRRSLLATMGGAAVAAPTLAAAASAPCMGEVEELARQLPMLHLAEAQVEQAINSLPHPSAVWDRLSALSLAAAQATANVENTIIQTQPKTVTDALLLIALASHLSHGMADFDMNNEPTSQHLCFLAGVSRRAADFIAASMGHDLSAVKTECWQQQGNGT